MPNKEKLHKEIITKFGTITKFAKLSGIDRYELQKIFARKTNPDKTLEKIAKAIDRTKVSPTEWELTPEQIKRLSEALDKAGGVIKFCRRHKRFPEKSVYQILQGRRKRMTRKVRELFEHFDITE